MDKLYQNEEWLYNQYWELEKSTPQIAEATGVIKDTIIWWMKKFGIKRRTNAEAAQLRIKKNRGHIPNLGKFGEENTNWKGGTGLKKSIHLQIRKIKGIKKICSKCGKKGYTELTFNHKLGDYTRNPDDYEELCVSCHRRKDSKLKNRIYKKR